MIELVVLGQNGHPVTTSLLVAQKFKKDHKHVLESIRELIKGSADFSAYPMFEERLYLNEQNGQEYPMFVMNRDGFTLLAMGFKGKKALQFKMDYIAAFNAMEAELKKRASAPTPALTPAEMLLQSAQMLVAHERKMAQIESRLDAMEHEQKSTIRQLTKSQLSNDDVPTITLRNKVRQLVNKYAVAHNIRQDFVWNKIYEQLYYVYGISIRRYKKGDKETLMDVAERNGFVEKMYAIISDMIRMGSHQSIN